MAYSLTTTGTVATVTLEDLGGLSFTHPTTVNLETKADVGSIAQSLANGDLAAAVTAGSITVTGGLDAVTDLVNAVDARVDTVAGDVNTLNETVGSLDQEFVSLSQEVSSNTGGLSTLRTLRLFPDQFDIKTAQWVYSSSANANKCAEFINATGPNGWEVSRTGGGNAPSYTTATVDGQTFQTPYLSMSTPTGYSYLICPIISPNNANGFIIYEAVLAFLTNFTDTANNSIYMGITTNSNVPVGEALTGYSLFLRRNPTVNSGNWQVVKVINGVTTVLLNSAVGFTQNSWLKLKVIMDRGANKAYFYIGDALIHTENSAGINTQQFWRLIMGLTGNVVNSSSWLLRFKDALYIVN